MLKHLLALSFLLSSSPALSCRMLPLEKNVDKYLYDWIKQTPDIYLAEAVSYSQEDEAVSLKVKEVIKGEKAESITVAGTLGTAQTTDYGLHTKDIFWNSILEGRTNYNANCRFKAEFETGRTYLVVAQEPFQAKSFEMIKNKNDWWYFRVKEILALKKYRRMIIKKEKEKTVPKETVPPPAETTPVEAAKTESP